MADSRQILADRIIFGECHKQHSLPNLLTADAPTMISAHDGKKQTAPSAPVVQINDLSKNHGNTVSVTIVMDTKRTSPRQPLTSRSISITTL